MGLLGAGKKDDARSRMARGGRPEIILVRKALDVIRSKAKPQSRMTEESGLGAACAHDPRDRFEACVSERNRLRDSDYSLTDSFPTEPIPLCRRNVHPTKLLGHLQAIESKRFAESLHDPRVLEDIERSH